MDITYTGIFEEGSGLPTVYRHPIGEKQAVLFYGPVESSSDAGGSTTSTIDVGNRR
jgi:hypothetical protein